MTAMPPDGTSPIGGKIPVGTASTSVFDAGLPTIEYDVTATPQQVYPQLLAGEDINALVPAAPHS